MLYIVICDDQPTHSQYTAQKIATTPRYTSSSLQQVSDPNELINQIEKGPLRPDITILDIKMDNFDGISLAQRINTLIPTCQIIFLTAYLEYAPRVYDTEHCYFVLKSEMDDYLIPALDKAVRKLREQSAEYITLENQQGGIRVLLSSIKYFERVLRKTRIVVQDGEYWSKMKPQNLLEDVNHADFFFCHQSFCVNMQYVSSLDANGFRLKNGDFVPVSRPYKHLAKERFLFKE